MEIKMEKVKTVFCRLQNFKNTPLLDKLETARENGADTVIIEVANGVRWGSHPEIARDAEWFRWKGYKEIDLSASCSRQELRRRVKQLHTLGYQTVPMLNFSAMHDEWLGLYERMISSAQYYTVCRDLVYEVSDLFDKPAYIHIGMNDENADHLVIDSGFAACRYGNLLWHDVEFFCDCVRETGAQPWMWADLLFTYPEEFKEHVDPENLLLSISAENISMQLPKEAEEYSFLETEDLL